MSTSRKLLQGHRSSHTGKKEQKPEQNFDPEGYDFTSYGRGSIPQGFRNMTISNAYVEFLRVGSDNTPVEAQNTAKNHAIIKVDLTSSYGEFDGVRINMQPDWELASDGPEGGPTYKPGQLFIKPV